MANRSGRLFRIEQDRAYRTIAKRSAEDTHRLRHWKWTSRRPGILLGTGPLKSSSEAARKRRLKYRAVACTDHLQGRTHARSEQGLDDAMWSGSLRSASAKAEVAESASRGSEENQQSAITNRRLGT